MSKIVLTGSTGFVGANLIEYLNKKNIQTVGLSRTEKKGYCDSLHKHLMLHSFNALIHLAGKAHDLKKVSIEKEYFDVNTELTKEIYNDFLNSEIPIFIYISSVKAVADKLDIPLDENHIPNPKTAYGISKLKAEQYIISKQPLNKKRVYILRPCMIHGPGNKGNLNLLFKFVSNGIPWPLGAFENRRSFCSIDNLMFVIYELITRKDIPSGVYNVSDDETLSTNEIISLIAKSKNKAIQMWKIPKWLVKAFARIGDFFNLPIDTERLEKLTQNYIVSNEKIKKVLDKELPITSINGMIKTLNSFN